MSGRDRIKTPTVLAAKKRRARARRKAGRRVVSAEVDEVNLVIALQDAGLLDVNAGEDRVAIERAWQRLVDQLMET